MADAHTMSTTLTASPEALERLDKLLGVGDEFIVKAPWLYDSREEAAAAWNRRAGRVRSERGDLALAVERLQKRVSEGKVM